MAISAMAFEMFWWITKLPWVLIRFLSATASGPGPAQAVPVGPLSTGPKHVRSPRGMISQKWVPTDNFFALKEVITGVFFHDM